MSFSLAIEEDDYNAKWRTRKVNGKNKKWRLIWSVARSVTVREVTAQEYEAVFSHYIFQIGNNIHGTNIQEVLMGASVPQLPGSLN